MALLTTLNFDVLRYKIAPLFDIDMSLNFKLVSRAAREIIVDWVMSPCHNITLSGRTVLKTPKSLGALFQQSFRLQAFLEYPQLQQALVCARAELTAKLKPRDMQALINHAHRIVIDPVFQANLASALVVMGLEGPRKEPSEVRDTDLGQALIKAVKQKQHRIVQAVFLHPNTINVPANGPLGLGAAVNVAINAMNFVDANKILLCHPNAAKIPAEDGEFGLSAALVRSINLCKAELVRTILLLPNAAKIPLEGAYGLVAATAIASHTDNQEILSLIINAWNNH